ncbi:Holliday junction branch migration protein RuvA [Desulfohalovibrio reitneri]|uniref:Holliday junction branch migration protein RuvA n=1 Tax=Desulfohalovibrio reitneri TaxID=1307759 RepID=UPI0004A764DD|nr:Holliday junction branch migration protein RuvA [Desulfohalovibrio reitneri]
MIAYLSGEVAHRGERSCVLLTPGGVGYEVHLAGRSLSSLPSSGEQAAFHTWLVVREDALDLYGFESATERSVFGLLISISKLGPRKAQALLDAYDPAELHRIAVEEDLTALTKVSGIGRKTGQQILLELQFKLKAEGFGAKPSAEKPEGTVFSDAVSGLVNLGYGEDEAAEAVRAVLAEEGDLDVAGALRAALKALAREKFQ